MKYFIFFVIFFNICIYFNIYIYIFNYIFVLPDILFKWCNRKVTLRLPSFNCIFIYEIKI